jgi:hypothetical protein
LFYGWIGQSVVSSIAWVTDSKVSCLVLNADSLRWVSYKNALRRKVFKLFDIAGIAGMRSYVYA